MKRILLGLLALVGLGAAAALSGVGGGALKTFFPREERNPVTHLRWNDSPDDFQFAIVSDRTGGHRANIFAQAVEKLNLMQPSFVVSVGDLIEGAKKDDALASQWKEFDSYVNRLTMPFFYVAGNHDAGNVESSKFWGDKLGRKHYHFVYRGVLFLMLNSSDGPEAKVALGKEQIAYAHKVLADNREARWTFVFVHHPLWATSNGEKNGWLDFEKGLAGRSYTVFAGHVHRYQKFVRQGMNHYQLATTGAGSALRGVEMGEFDHFAWITMKKGGPLLANLMLDALLPEDLRKIPTDESANNVARKKLQPAGGEAFLDGSPIPGAVVMLTGESGDAKGVKSSGIVEADGAFRLTTYKLNDGAPAGDYAVTATWREIGKDGRLRNGAQLMPARYLAVKTSGLRATIREGANALRFELKK